MGEPERVRVVAYQNHLDRTPLPHGANRNDLFISGCKVSQPTGSGSGSEDRDFTFDAAFGPETVPVSVVRSEVPLAVDAFLDGINAVLLVLGASGSGKDELLAGTPATGGAERWEGLVEHLIRSVYAALRESGEGGVASGAARLQLQFLHIDSERVQDLLEPDCHSHNLQLADDDEAGTLVREARPEVLKGEAHAISLYRRGVQSVHTLGRYHAVDVDAACSILTLTLTRRSATEAGPTGVDGELAASYYSSTLSVVGLPGTERLRTRSREHETREAQYEMHIAEGAFKHRSITQFGELTKALARRGQRTQHVPWRGGKLVRLVGERLGGNARVQAIATLKGGQRDESRATLKCAAELRRVVQYPLVNTTVARSLLALKRAELKALREDIQAMQVRGVPPPQPILPSPGEGASLPRNNSGGSDARELPRLAFETSGLSEDISSTSASAPAAAPVATADAPTGTTDGAEVPTLAALGAAPLQSSLAPPKGGGDTRLEQSERVGQQLTTELLQARLKEHKVQAKRHKEELHEQIRKLENEMLHLQREKLEEQSEKLRAAKALVELEVDGQALVDAKEAEADELKGLLDEARQQKEAADDEARSVAAQLKARQKELESEVAKREHAEEEALAARYTLELAQRESASVAASKEDLDLEVVSSVNAARQREAQLSELGVSLDRARSQTEEAREQLRTEQARADGLAADLAASKRERAEAAARAESLSVEMKRLSVQHELREVTASQERAELKERLQVSERQTKGGRRTSDVARGEEMGERATDNHAAEGRSAPSGDATAQVVAKWQEARVRAELCEARSVATESAARADALEEELAMADERARRAQDDYRLMLERQVEQRAALSVDEASFQQEIAEMNRALLHDARQGEASATARLQALQSRHQRLRTGYERLRGAVLDPAKHSAKQHNEPASTVEGASDGADVAELEHRVAQLEEARRALADRLERAGQAYTAALAEMRPGHLADKESPPQIAGPAVPPSPTPPSGSEAHVVGERKREAAAMVRAIQTLTAQKAELQRQLERRHVAEDELKNQRAEIERLQAARGDFKQDYAQLRSASSLQVQVKEMSSTIAALESERPKLLRRAATAEQQLASLQESMTSTVQSYQKEILQLRRSQAGAAQGPR